MITTGDEGASLMGVCSGSSRGRLPWVEAGGLGQVIIIPFAGSGRMGTAIFKYHLDAFNEGQ